MASNGKISLRQAIFLVLDITFTPALRVIPSTTAGAAGQAAWLSPIPSFVLLIPVIFALKSVYSKYQDKSFTEILEVIFGRFIGKMVTFVYILFILALTAINARSTSEQLVLSVYPQVKPDYFILAMLILIAFSVYKGGFTVIARMGEILLPVFVAAFLLLCCLASQNIKLGRILPICGLDIVPVLKASTYVSGVEAHLPLMFLLSNFINNKEKIGKACTWTAVMFTILLIILLVTVIGSLGAETTADAPLPFMTAVKLISVFQSIERIEPIVVMLWIFSDYLLISVLLISVLNMLQSLFKLSNTRNLIAIHLIVVYFLAMTLGRNLFEVQRFLVIFLPPLLLILGYALPLLVWIAGKARKKL